MLCCAVCRRARRFTLEGLWLVLYAEHARHVGKFDCDRLVGLLSGTIRLFNLSSQPQLGGWLQRVFVWCGGVISSTWCALSSRAGCAMQQSSVQSV